MTNPAEEIDRARSFAEAYTAAWCSQNPERVASFYAEDGLLSINDAPPAVGREAVTAIAQGFMSEFSDLRVFLDELQQEDGRVIYHWALTGTNMGPGGTGCAVHLSGRKVWRSVRRVGSLRRAHRRGGERERERECDCGELLHNLIFRLLSGKSGK